MISSLRETIPHKLIEHQAMDLLSARDRELVS